MASIPFILAACLATSPSEVNSSGGGETVRETEQSGQELHVASPGIEITPSATPVWFPPTTTPTPYPTAEVFPTPDMRPGLGQVILTDNFSSAEAWSIASNTTGRIGLSKQELTIAIAPTETKEYYFSIRQEPHLSDFYAEITASTSLCKGDDEYGMLIRATSQSDYYRFAVTCNGQARLERIIAGQTTAPQNWVLSGSIPPGAPGIARLGVWANGKEMRFFSNDEYLFTINDPLLTNGMLGVYARSAGENAVTVNFSALEVREISR
jgi:hypothetical protein